MDWAKKHPIILGASVLAAFIVWRYNSDASTESEENPEYSSGTTIVGTPNPLGGITTDTGSGSSALADSGFSDQLAQFFQLQNEQSKNAQIASQTASLAIGNTELLKTMLSRVGKGQDATFEYNELGQVTKIDADAQELPLLNPLQQAKQDAAVYAVQTAAAQKAVNAGVTNPYPNIKVTSKSQKQAATLTAKANTILAKAAAALAKSETLTGKKATRAATKADNLTAKANVLQAKATAKLGQ